jgi:hypothetical protein
VPSYSLVSTDNMSSTYNHKIEMSHKAPENRSNVDSLRLLAWRRDVASSHAFETPSHHVTGELSSFELDNGDGSWGTSSSESKTKFVSFCEFPTPIRGRTISQIYYQRKPTPHPGFYVPTAEAVEGDEYPFELENYNGVTQDDEEEKVEDDTAGFRKALELRFESEFETTGFKSTFRRKGTPYPAQDMEHYFDPIDPETESIEDSMEQALVNSVKNVYLV